MSNTVSQLISACAWSPVKFFVISQNVFDPLIYYSHLLPLILCLILGIFVFTKNSEKLEVKVLFTTIVLLSCWLISDLIVWATDKPQLTMFFWSITIITEPIIYGCTLYFIYAFIDGKDISFGKKMTIAAMLLPTILLTPTPLALLGYDISNCDRDAIEGPLVYYGYAIEIIFIIWLIVLAIQRYVTQKDSESKKKILAVSIGSVGFLTAFAFGNIIGSFFTAYSIGGDESWEFGQYGIFGVPIFIAFLTFIIVRFKAFNIKLIGTQALSFLIGVLLISLAFVQSVATIHLIILITFFLFLVIGTLLVQSVKQVDQQNDIIAATNKQLENLLHFISHEVKGALNKSRIALNEIIDTSDGKIPAEIQKMALNADADTKKSIEMVMNILGSADFKSGKIAVTKVPFDFKAALVESEAELSIDAKAKGLTFETEIDEKDNSGAPADYTITGDKEQLTKHVIRNLIDNSIKYTPSGGLKIHLGRKDAVNGKGGLITLSIKDTGVGITPTDMQHLFTEGGKGEHSTDVNVHSTGYGLFFAKSIITNHNGKVWAQSEGAGKGSQFYVELPAAA